jgi:hypothetical protein
VPGLRARSVAFVIIGLLHFLARPTTAQQRYTMPHLPAARPLVLPVLPALPDSDLTPASFRLGSALTACAVPACGLVAGSAPAFCAVQACGLVRGPGPAGCALPACGLVPVSGAASADARRASTYPAVAVWSFASAVVGAVALAGIGYALGLAGDAGYDSWLTPSDVLGALGIVIGYPAGGAIGAVVGARRAGLRPHTGTVVLVSYLGAAAGVLVGAGVGRTIPSEGLPAIIGVTIHLGFTTVAAHESGR